MSLLSPNLRGIIFMVLATGLFVVNDTFLKLATVGLPPFEVAFLRGIAASLWGLPLVLLTGNGPRLKEAVNRWILLRNLLETGAVICFILALSQLAISETSAINLMTPVLVVLASGFLYREKIGVLRGGLVLLGLVGGLLVAQPSASGISPYMLAAFGCAFLSGGRDLAGKSVPHTIPAFVVIFSILVCVGLGSGVAMLIFEQWVAPTTRHILLLAGSGFFLVFGHLFIFLSYRTGETGVVAPFFYMFAVFAVVSQIIVFGSLPTAMAFAGIALILASGVTIAVMDERKRRLTPIAAARMSPEP